MNPLVAGAAVAAMSFSLLGIAAITGILPGALSQKSADPASLESPAHGKSVSCPSCGIVQAIRAVEVHNVYRVTVRMDDGSFRTVSQSAAPVFAVGDKVRVEQGRLVAAKS
jgi:hypothetical protein